MPFRIDTAEVEATTLISVQGQLLGDAVAQLEMVSRNARDPRVVDLALLQTADAEGIGALVTLAGEGVELLNASPYIELLIERKRTNGE